MKSYSKLLQSYTTRGNHGVVKAGGLGDADFLYEQDKNTILLSRMLEPL